jgi:hypothetical protein
VEDLLVGTDTRGFEGFTGELFQLVGDQVDAQWEIEHTGGLETKIVDTDLRIRDTTVKPRLWVRLIFAVTVASGWTTPHGAESKFKT